jgi:glycosyltransferase involved in cell wall biosynthesis
MKRVSLYGTLFLRYEGEAVMEKKVTNRPELTISLLASNRPDTIPRCLDSVRELMKEIPSELIIVDTSGSEQIHRLLLNYTDQVIPFTWCGDFSKARNEGLKRAKGEWFLYLDDDEWLVETKPLVDFFQSGAYRKYTCANYIVRSFYDTAYTSFSDSWVSRMVKVTPEVCFQGKIHEYIYGAASGATTIPMIAYHSGYVYATEADRRKHFERNANLLKEMIREEPQVLRWKVQLAQEYRSVREWKELSEFCEKCLAECKEVNAKYANYDIGTFYAGAIMGYLYTDRLDKGAEMCEAALHDARNSELCHANTYHYLGLIEFYRKEWKKAEDYMHRFLSLERELKKDPAKLEEQKWGLLVCEAFDVVPMKRAYSVLIVCGWKQKRVDALHKYFKKLEWNDKSAYELDRMPEYLIEAVATLPKDPVLDEMLADGWSNEGMKKKLFVCAEGWKERDRKGYYNILRAISGIQDRHWYPSYAAVMYAAYIRKVKALPAALAKFGSHLDNIFLFPQEVSQIALENNISLEPVYLAVPYEKWCQSLQEYINEVERNDLKITLQELKGMQRTQDIRYLYAFARLSETLVVSSTRDRDYEQKHPLFAEYAEHVDRFARNCYRESVIEEYPELLPENLQAGILVKKALETEMVNLAEAMRLYHRAAQAYPPLSEAMKAYMIRLQFHAEQQERVREEEFRKLLKESKRQVREFLDKGDAASAGAVLPQLMRLAPEDLEVAELMLRVRLA